MDGDDVIAGSGRPAADRRLTRTSWKMSRSDISVKAGVRVPTSTGSGEGQQESSEYITPNATNDLYHAAHDDQVFYACDMTAIFVMGGRLTFAVKCEGLEEKAKGWQKSLNRFSRTFGATRWYQEVMLNKLLFGQYYGHIITQTGEDGIRAALKEWGVDIQTLPHEKVIPKVNQYDIIVGYYDSDDVDSSSEGKDDPKSRWNVDVIIDSYWRRLGTDKKGFGLAQQLNDLISREDQLWQSLHELLIRAAHGLLHGKVKVWDLHERGLINANEDDPDSSGTSIAASMMDELDTLLAGRVTTTTSGGRTLISSIANNIVTSDAVELVPVELKNDIAGLIDAIKITENRKTRALRIPKFVMEGEGANRSTSDTQATLMAPGILFEQMILDDDLWHNGLLPVLRKNLSISPEAEIEIVHEPFMPEDRVLLAQTIEILVGTGVLDPATEGREMWGLPAIPGAPDPFAGAPAPVAPKKGPGGHTPDATGPYGAGAGPGEGKGDGTGLEAQG